MSQMEWIQAMRFLDPSGSKGDSRAALLSVKTFIENQVCNRE